MAEKSKTLLSIGAALASLSGLSVQGAEAKIAVVNDDAKHAGEASSQFNEAHRKRPLSGG